MRNLDHACLQPIQLLGSLITYYSSLYLALFIILLVPGYNQMLLPI